MYVSFFFFIFILFLYSRFNPWKVDDVLNGANPIFEEFGPYYYRVDIQKFDIEFINNGTEVEYNEAK